MYVAVFAHVTRLGLPSEYFTDQTLTNDLCKSVRYIFFKDGIDKEEKLNHKWIERKDVEKSGARVLEETAQGGYISGVNRVHRGLVEIYLKK